MGDERFARQVLYSGEKGQARLAAAHVGIVGLGGIGSQVAQALAYLGVGSFVLVDDDRVDTTNLNRLIGATAADARERALKVEVAQRTINTINPQLAVRAIAKNLRSYEALEDLTGCPVIFGCVDHDGPRLILMELAAAYEATLIDSASEINSENSPDSVFGGRVIVCRPGELCLDCAQAIDLETANKELDTKAQQELRRAHGYGLGEQTPAPAVVSFNGVVANLAVTEFLMTITEFRDPQSLTYRGMGGRVNVRLDTRRADCYTCGYLAGKGDRADILRYALPEEAVSG